MLRKRRLACLTLASVGLLAAAPVRAQPTGYVARVTSIVVWTLDPDQFAQLTPAKLAELQQKGIQVDEATRTLQSPELGMAGHWLQFKKFGPRRYPTDMDGYVHVPTMPPVTTGVKVFAQVDDKTELAVLDKITFVPEGQTPPATVLRLTYSPPLNMTPPQPPGGPPPPPHAGDPSDRSLTRVASLGGEPGSPPDVVALLQPPPPPPPQCSMRGKCAATGSPGSNAPPGCCLDYDGLMGDGLPYRRDGNCAGYGYLNFVWST